MADNDNDGWSTIPAKQKTTSSSSNNNNKSQSKTREKKQKQPQQQRHHDYDVVISPTTTNIEMYESPFMVICVGLPGSGKSTFSRSLIKSNPNKFGRINQDELKTRQKCERKVKKMLSPSTSSSSATTTTTTLDDSSSQSQSIQQQQQRQLCPIIDRCNFDMTQRSTWYRLAEECSAADGGNNIPVDVVVFDIPYEVCLRRCEIRKGHETIKSPQQAAGILKQLKREWKPPPYNNNEQKRYRSLTIIRTDQEQKECLIRFLNQPF
ncbi:MAG: putative kinase [Bacillariaceae sp.]|jgi:predicted kinase